MPAWTFNSFIRTPLLLMALVEAFILFSSVYVAAYVVFGNIPDGEETVGWLAPKATALTAINLAALVAMGLYHFHQRYFFREAMARVLTALIGGFAVLAIVYYALPFFALSRDVASVAAAYSLIALLVVRFYFVHRVDDNVFRRRTLIYGAGERARSISDLRRRADRRGFVVVGKVAAPGDTQANTADAIQSGDASILDVAVKSEADEIVVAMDDRRGNLPIRELLDARLQGIEVIDLLEFLERETGKIRIDLVNPGWLIFQPGFRKSRFRRFNKRAVDILVSGALLVVTWPIMLIAAIAIKIEDGLKAPVFYRQTRVGRGNKNFDVLKYRSMRVDAESDGKAVWASKNDSRVTRVGEFLRKTRLDELPQLFNVLSGQMSLVGPRPERPQFVEDLRESVPYYAERHTVKPGVTGWAQVRYSYGASEEDAAEKLQYDLYYVKNQSLLLDILIILQTVEVVLWGKGAR